MSDPQPPIDVVEEAEGWLAAYDDWLKKPGHTVAVAPVQLIVKLLLELRRERAKTAWDAQFPTV